MTKKLQEQQEKDETGVDKAITRGQGQIPGEKVQAFKSLMSRMHQVTTQASTSGTAPAKATVPSKPAQQQKIEPSSATPTTPGEKSTNIPGQQGPSLQQQLSQATAQPAAAQGFVELKRNVSDAAVKHIATQLGVEEDRLKKLAMDADVRLLINPDLLKVQ